MNQSLTTTNAKSAVAHAFSKNGALSVGGIAIGEIAILGAAGYILWKNKEQIQNLLEKGGVQVPSIMKADMNELVATGAAFIAKSKRAFAEEGNSQNTSSNSSGTSQSSASNNNSSSNTNSFNANASKPAAASAQFANKDTLGAKKSTTIHDA